MQERGDRRIWLLTSVALAASALAYLVLSGGESDSTSDKTTRAAQLPGTPLSEASTAKDGDAAMVVDRGQPRWVSTHERVLRQEALPCTGTEDPINFEVFSAGSAVAGVPMTGTVRRCDAGALADESTSNYFAYVYGDCQALAGGCRLPLQIRSYPACQRSYSEYEFEGKPLPYKELPPVGGAVVREIEFLVDHRIEIYTGTSTIAISAADWSLAEEALGLLRGQSSGKPPAATAASLAQEQKERLEPPVKGAIEGDLQCRV
jgi:hypothetical protein